MNELVSLNLQLHVRVPQTVLLPMALATLLGVKRHLKITRRDQAVPRGIRQWMAQDVRYRQWLGELEPVEKQEAAAPPQPEATPPADDQPTPPADTPADSADPETLWDARWTVPKLRDYAERFDIPLTAQDNKKDEIVAKIRAARPAFEVLDSE